MTEIPLSHPSHSDPSRSPPLRQPRSTAIAQRVHDVMALIEKEMRNNGGLYPYNHHRLSAAEVARRAQVHPTTLHTSAQRSLHREIREWLAKFSPPTTVARAPLRRGLAQRVADWRSLYERLAQAHRDTELTLQQREAELVDAKAEIANLTRALASLKRTQKASITSMSLTHGPRTPSST